MGECIPKFFIMQQANTRAMNRKLAFREGLMMSEMKIRSDPAAMVKAWVRCASTAATISNYKSQAVLKVQWFVPPLCAEQYKGAQNSPISALQQPQLRHEWHRTAQRPQNPCRPSPTKEKASQAQTNHAPRHMRVYTHTHMHTHTYTHTHPHTHTHTKANKIIAGK